MSAQNSINKPTLSEPITDILQEVQQTPQEYLPNLLQMIRLFQESVTMKAAQSDAWQKTPYLSKIFDEQNTIVRFWPFRNGDDS